MTTAAHERRQLRETPYKADHDTRVTSLMEERGTMPKTLNGLLVWYARECFGEVPAELHTSQVWRDRVNLAEAENGVRPVGSSDTGALAYADDFRRTIENSPSEIDEDGYYRRPIASALSRLARKRVPKGGSLMAARLIALARLGFDWQRQADNIGWHHDEMHVYMREALICLWNEYRAEPRSVAA